MALRCAAVSPAEQYAAQRTAMLQEKREERVKQAFEEKLGGVGDQAHLLEKGFWRALAGGDGLSIADAPSDATLAGIASRHHASTTPAAMKSRENLELLLERGFCGVEGVDWGALGVDFAALARTMDALKAAGWPPVFVFMFDETWRVLETLFDVAAPLLQDEELVLEASVYGWALEKPLKDEGAPGEMVGGNFGVPHRDAAYLDSHTAEGPPNILGLWIPVVDVTSENGCMFVVPRERDRLFMEDEDRLHRAPHLMPDFPHAHVRPLVADAGTVLAWHHNTIHWGSSCSPYADHPRKSIAMSFRLRDEGKPWTEKDDANYWRRPFTRAELSLGVDMETRLRMCAGALVTYSVWHPEFKGFDKGHLGVEA